MPTAILNSLHHLAKEVLGRSFPLLRLSALFCLLPASSAFAAEVCPDLEIICPDGVSRISVDAKFVFGAGCKPAQSVVTQVAAECPAPVGCPMDTLYQKAVVNGDGCSAKDVKDAMVQAGVTPACQIHDMCYSFYGAKKADCDRALGHNRGIVCTGAGCGAAGWQEGVIAVHPDAADAYVNGQRWAKANCEPKDPLRPTQVDAAVNWTGKVINSGKAFLFQGSRYGRYDLQGSAYDSGYPKSTATGWKLPKSWGGQVDAAVNWGNGRAYLFKGNKYVSYDLNASEPGPEKDTQSNWHFPAKWNGEVDAAVNWGNGYAYFFRGQEVVTFRIGANSPEKHMNTAGWGFPASWGGKVDAAVNWGNGVAYFFRGDQYIRYKLDAKQPDDRPRSVLVEWKIPVKK